MEGDRLRHCRQTIDYCGVGAHNQNGIVERNIGLMTNGSRTLLLRAMRRWPDMISTLLWPYAWKEVERRNNYFSYNRHGEHPIQSFAKVTYPPKLRDYHTWGCLVFVLHDKAREVVNPKWDPKARLRVYLGHSSLYAGSVALVLNPRTLHISPQYHVVFDDDFTTVQYLSSEDTPPTWTQLCKDSRELATDVQFELATR